MLGQSCYYGLIQLMDFVGMHATKWYEFKKIIYFNKTKIQVPILSILYNYFSFN